MSVHFTNEYYLTVTVNFPAAEVDVDKTIIPPLDKLASKFNKIYGVYTKVSHTWNFHNDDYHERCIVFLKSIGLTKKQIRLIEEQQLETGLCRFKPWTSDERVSLGLDGPEL